jgi:hypothetical protein
MTLSTIKTPDIIKYYYDNLICQAMVLKSYRNVSSGIHQQLENMPPIVIYRQATFTIQRVSGGFYVERCDIYGKELIASRVKFLKRRSIQLLDN